MGWIASPPRAPKDAKAEKRRSRSAAARTLGGSVPAVNTFLSRPGHSRPVAPLRRCLLPVSAVPLVLLSVLVAGCAVPPEELQAGRISAAGLGGTLAFGEAAAMEQPTGGAEPNVAVTADGRLFITAVAGSQERPNALEGAAWLWRSTDDGTTWETLRAPVRETPLGTGVPQTRKPFGSSDADVVASDDGWVYYSDWWNWGSPVLVPMPGAPAPAPGNPLPVSPNSRFGSYMVERSGDGGDTWDSVPITTLDTVGGIDRQWLVPGKDGYLGVYYAYFHGVQNTVRGLGDLYGRADGVMSIQAVHSFDHGATWSRPTTVVEPVAGRGYQIAHPWVHPAGAIVMPYGDVYPGSDFWRMRSHVRLAVSLDNGTSWATHTVAEVPEGFDNLWAVQGAVDAAGAIHVAWAARTGANMTLFHAESRDLGITWTEPLALRAEGLNFLPWVAVRGDGEVAIAWYGGDSTGKPEEAPEDAEWFAYVAHRAAPGAPWRLGLANGDAPVKIGPMCPKGAACTGDRELLDYPSLAFDADGNLHVAYATSREVNGVKAGLVTYAAATAGTLALPTSS